MLEGVWAQETEDSVWTAETATFFEQTLRAVDASPNIVRGVACGTRICRVELLLEELGVGAALQAAADQPDVEYEIDKRSTDRGLAVLLYLTRPGTTIAKLTGYPALTP